MRAYRHLIIAFAVAVVSCGPAAPAPRPPKPFAGSVAAAPSSSAAGAAQQVDGAAGVAPTPPPVPAGVSTASSDPAWMRCGSVEFPKPASWAWVQPTAPFRTLQYAVPGKAELIVSVFTAGDGGAVDANVERWAKQFGGASSVRSRSERAVGDMRVTRVDFEGEFKGMGMAQAQAGMAQLGAIVQGPAQSVFIRLLGSRDAVEAQRDAFEALVSGARPQS